MPKKKWKPWIIEKIISKGDYNYCIVRNHPHRTKNDYVLHHRVLMENHLERLLHDNEEVHHINEKKKDNRISNFELLTNVEHRKLHAQQQGEVFVKFKCPCCGTKFERPKHKTYLIKGGLFASCSPQCRGRFSKRIQVEGLTKDVKEAITESVRKEYIKFKYT